MRQDLSSQPTTEFKKPPAGSIGGLHGGVSCEFLCLSSLLFLALTSQSQMSSEEVDLPILLGNVLLQQLVLLQDLLQLRLLLLLLLLVVVLLLLAGIMARMLDDEEDLRDEDERHGEVAAEDVGQRHEGKRGVMLVRDDHSDGGGDDAEDGHVVDGHPHQPAVVDLLHLHTAGLVRQEESKDEQQTFVAIGETQPNVLIVGTADPDLRAVLNVVVLVVRWLEVKLDLLLLQRVDQLPDGDEHGVNGDQAANHGPELPGNDLGL